MYKKILIRSETIKLITEFCGILEKRKPDHQKELEDWRASLQAEYDLPTDEQYEWRIADYIDRIKVLEARLAAIEVVQEMLYELMK